MHKMKFIHLFGLFLFVFSCGKEKVIQLPEINHSEISEITDVSPCYLFYNEAEKDSVELNRKNLISSTNWLLNIDKRLTLKQIIPHLTFLQNKKSNSSHKKEGTKNYFTCNNTSKKNLGFIEFTDVVYHTETFQDYLNAHKNFDFSNKMKIDFINSKEIYAEFPVYNLSGLVLNQSNFKKYIEIALANETQAMEIMLFFNENLSFQDYVSFQSTLSNLNLKNILVSPHEFITSKP